MAELSIFKRECNTVFGLNGYDENSATYALGWALHKSPTLLKIFLKACLDSHEKVDTEAISIKLQEHGKDRGYTDLEIIYPGRFHIVVEAKRGWSLPGKEQLTKYTSRFEERHKKTPGERQLFITMSAASEEYAGLHQEPQFEGYPLRHLSWKMLHGLAQKARCTAKSTLEKLWLQEFTSHIKGYISMTNPTDNRALCVVLSGNNIHKGVKYTWVDVVAEDGYYFHPVGVNGWPASPPNYLAFRRHGKLMSVHHVEECKVVDQLQDINEDWPNINEPHFLYKLGSAMKPPKEMKNGGIYNTQRIWCALDTLLSGDFETIKDARDETQKRN